MSVCAEAGAGALLVTALDEVAWLLNLRGGDVDYNPVFVSYVVVEHQNATLYVDQQKVRADCLVCVCLLCALTCLVWLVDMRSSVVCHHVIQSPCF